MKCHSEVSEIVDAWLNSMDLIMNFTGIEYQHDKRYYGARNIRKETIKLRRWNKVIKILLTIVK